MEQIGNTPEAIHIGIAVLGLILTVMVFVLLNKLDKSNKRLAARQLSYMTEKRTAQEQIGRLSSANASLSEYLERTKAVNKDLYQQIGKSDAKVYRLQTVLASNLVALVEGKIYTSFEYSKAKGGSVRVSKGGSVSVKPAKVGFLINEVYVDINTVATELNLIKLES